ncbi:MAG: hypothetical protein Q8R26_03475 [bacterium]|nr:hypothetical protein [bacterium]
MRSLGFNLHADEEKALVGILYNHITYTSTLEVFGGLTPDGIKRLETLRTILAKLLKKYELVATLTEDAYLLLGLTEFISKSFLETCATGANMHLKKRAEFFLQKRNG